MITEAMGPVKYANFSVATKAANQIVAAVTGKKIRVLGMVLNNNDASTAVNATVEQSDGSNLIGPLRLASGATVVLSASGLGYHETAASQALAIRLSGTQTVAGSVTYQVV